MEWPPDYVAVSADRAWRLDRMRQNPEVLRGAKIVYRTNPVEFIEHWVTTYDPQCWHGSSRDNAVYPVSQAAGNG
jgi:hypothetical protein